MDYANKIYSLEERASARVAINLCQETGFKEVALCLEKPTYGCFIDSSFVSDPEMFSLTNCYDRQKVRRWEEAVDEQCRRLTDGLPRCLRQRIHPWMNLIALEYLSYCRRQEALFGVSRYFLMNFFTTGDWKEDARFDEEKLAQRLLADDQLTVLQRYRIACAYCLHVHIPQLWERLTQEEKRFTTGNDSLETYDRETNRMVLMWSHHMNGNGILELVVSETYDKETNEIFVLRSHHMNEILKLVASESCLFLRAVGEAKDFGNCVAVKLCWKRLNKPIQQQMVITMALEFLRKWQSMEIESVKRRLVSNESHRYQSDDSTKHFSLPSCYSELIRFFLSHMDKEQQLAFFKKSFQAEYCNQSRFSKSVLECFLDCPYQDEFLPTVNRLWGIIPKYKYGQCLLALAGKYSRNNEKGIRDYDYGSLICTLWDNTPVEYKEYIFCDKEIHFSMTNEGDELLSVLLKRSPFLEKDETLFKHIFRDQPQEGRRAMLLSKMGRNMCSLLVQKEKWSFMNILLDECLSKEEVSDFKKKFIQSGCGVELCVGMLSEDRVKLVEDLLGWSLESDAEKAQHKVALISDSGCLDACKPLLRKGEFAKVESVINFCSSSDAEKERSKANFAQYVCIGLLDDYASQRWSVRDPVWDEMNKIIDWILGTEEQIRDMKNNIFSSIGFDVHYNIIFTQHLWEEVERFYKWFGLSPEEIKEFKKDTLFDSRIIEDIHQDLPDYAGTLVASLLWCITDEEMVIDLKKKVVEEYFAGVLSENEKMEKERLDNLISELLDGFSKKEVRDKTSREGVFVNDKGEKRSFAVIEGKTTSPRKRSK